MKQRYPWFNRIKLGISAAKELGLCTVGWYGIYKIGLRSGYFRRCEDRYKQESVSQDWIQKDWLSHIHAESLQFHECYIAFLRSFPAQEKEMLENAEEVLQGYYHPFGGQKTRIVLEPPKPLYHWSEYEMNPVLQKTIGDLKIPWEAARFGWAYTLCRAYMASSDDRYARFFWEKFELFSRENPYYLGVNWISAQEAGLRILVFTFALIVF